MAAPWPDAKLPVSVLQWRHLSKVLRKNRGDKVTYTDGLGTFGHGVLGHQEILRGEETNVERPTSVTLAVAPPASKDRQRFLVEKLTEIGVARLLWVGTEHGKNRVASASKVFGWITTALEQSRGSWLMEAEPDVISVGQLEPPLVFCHPGGTGAPSPGATIVIGPEGGFSDNEIPQGAMTWDLGSTVLRVETAAVVAAARIAGC